MKDISDILFHYLEAKRHLWNTYFVGAINSLHECSPLDEFEEIDILLFSGLVLKSIAKKNLYEKLEFGRDAFDFIKVVPREGLETLRVMIGEKTSKLGSMKWSKAIDLSMNGIESSFVNFFEWNHYGYVNYPYCRARITQSGTQEMLGKDILVEVANIRFLSAEQIMSGPDEA